MGGADEDQLYAAMDWLSQRQEAYRDEAGQAPPDRGGALVLYDLSSSYFEGSSCPLGCVRP